MDQNGKKPWESKSIWLGVIMGVLGALSAFFPQLNTETSWINAHMGEIGMVWGVLAIVIRTITKDKIVLAD